MADDVNAGSPAEDSTYIIRRRDYADIAHLQDATAMERFLEQPANAIAGQMADWLLVGSKALILAGPKIALAAITIKALEQFGKELNNWKKNGSIPEDFAGRKPGWQSFVELFAEIDSNPTDEERLAALKAMFLEANGPNKSDGQRILAYQLFQVAKKLSSGELLVLRTAQRIGGAGHDSAQNWLAEISNAMGHGVTALIAQHERALVDNGLISPRFDSNLRVEAVNGRLTDLGLAFCRNIDAYEIESRRSSEVGSQ